MNISPKKDDDGQYEQREAQVRFEAALKGAMNTPHKPLKEKPKVKKVAKEMKTRRERS